MLNVSGTTFETTDHCLQRYPNTLLGNYDKLNRFYVQHEDLYYFNRHRLAFEGILWYYQSFGRIACPPNVPNEVFQAELEFFEIDCQFLQQMEEAKIFVVNSTEEIVEVTDLKSRIWNVLQNPTSSLGAQILSMVSLFMTIISIGFACYLPEDQVKKTRIHRDIFPYEATCFVWFTLEFLARFFTSPSKVRLMKSWVEINDFVTLVIFYSTLALSSVQASSTSVLRVFRLVNVFRVFRLTRFSNGLRLLIYTIYRSRTDLQLLSSFMCFFILISGSCVYFAEVGDPRSAFSTQCIFSGFWFSLISCTTVGYGDIVPITTFGKLLSALTITFGAMFILLPVLKLVTSFSDTLKATRRLLHEQKEAAEGSPTNSPRITTKVKPQTSLLPVP